MSKNGPFLRPLVVMTLLFSVHDHVQSQFLFTNMIDTTRIDAQTTRGMALGDFDRDGLLDLYLCSNPGPSYLYHNEGGNRFTDVSRRAGVKIDLLTAAPTWIDFDNDGDLDLFVASYWEPNRLFRNDGGYFRDVAETAGVQEIGKTSNQGAWADYDRDGRADLLIANFEGSAPNALYHNNGDGTFTNVSDKVGIGPPATARAAIWGDYNNDLWPDLYIHGQSGTVLYTNNGHGFFRKTNVSPALDDFCDGLACTWRDVNNDGFLDLTLGAWNAYLRLSLNHDGTFSRADRFFPGAIPQNNGGATYADIDNDGFPDLYTKEVYGKEFLYKNNNGKGFIDITRESGLEPSTSGGNAVSGDMDNDGDIDLIAVQFEQHRLFYYVNGLEKITPSNHWLKVELIGIHSNRSAIGAKVRLYSRTTVQMQEKSCGESGQSQSSPLLHFGLRADARIDSIIVHWPSGVVQKETAIAVDETITIKEKAVSTTVADPHHLPDGFTLQNYPNPFNAVTIVRYRIPASGNVRLEIYDVLGKPIRLLSDGYQAIGEHSLSWDGTDQNQNSVPSGIYMIRLQAMGFVQMRKVVLAR